MLTDRGAQILKVQIVGTHFLLENLWISKPSLGLLENSNVALLSPYSEIVSLSALIAYNAMNWPGGAAISCLPKFDHWLMLYTLGQYIVNVQWSNTSDGFLTIIIFGICDTKYNCAILFWGQLHWLFIYLSKRLFQDGVISFAILYTQINSM